MDEFELSFNGSPSEFGVMAKGFDRYFVIDGARYPISDPSPFAIGELRPDSNPIYARLYQRARDGIGSAERLRITAQKMPGGKSMLRIQFYNDNIEGFDDYPEAFKRWEQLKAEMGRQGWIDLNREKPAEQEILSEFHVCAGFERQFVG